MFLFTEEGSDLRQSLHDQFMVDVTEIPEAKEGDPVTLLGKDGSECITMEELGELSGRFNYEFACLITPRVPRICIQES